MNQKMNPFAGFNSMNQMGNQMMMNMMNMMGNMNQPGSGQPQQPFAGTVFNPSWNVQQINQIITCINQMHQQSWQILQMMYAQNCQMTQQLFQMMAGMCNNMPTANMPFANMPFANMPNAPFAQQNKEGEAESEE